MRRRVLHLLPLMPLLLWTACAKTPRWEIANEQRAESQMVADALDDAHANVDARIDGSLVPDLAPPQHLRPCCAFGTDLRVRMGAIPVPLVSLGNIVSAEGLGPHRYDNGLVTLDSSDHRGWIDLARL